MRSPESEASRGARSSATPPSRAVPSRAIPCRSLRPARYPAIPGRRGEGGGARPPLPPGQGKGLRYLQQVQAGGSPAEPRSCPSGRLPAARGWAEALRQPPAAARCSPRAPPRGEEGGEAGKEERKSPERDRAAVTWRCRSASRSLRRGAGEKLRGGDTPVGAAHIRCEHNARQETEKEQPRKGERLPSLPLSLPPSLRPKKHFIRRHVTVATANAHTLQVPAPTTTQVPGLGRPRLQHAPDAPDPGTDPKHRLGCWWQKNPRIKAPPPNPIYQQWCRQRGHSVQPHQPLPALQPLSKFC